MIFVPVTQLRVVELTERKIWIEAEDDIPAGCFVTVQG